MKRCPKCGCEEFIVTQHVTQTIVVNSEGNFIKEVSACDDIVHRADDDDIWQCNKCGYDAAGHEFNVKKE